MGEYDFSGIDSLSPKAINQGIISSQIENEKYPLWIPWVFSGVPSIHSFQNLFTAYALSEFTLFERIYFSLLEFKILFDMNNTFFEV